VPLIAEFYNFAAFFFLKLSPLFLRRKFLGFAPENICLSVLTASKWTFSHKPLGGPSFCPRSNAPPLRCYRNATRSSFTSGLADWAGFFDFCTLKTTDKLDGPPPQLSFFEYFLAFNSPPFKPFQEV